MIKPVNFFFTPLMDLREFKVSDEQEAALFTLYKACKQIEFPNKYGEIIEAILIDAIHQDHETTFFPPSLKYIPERKAVEAGVKVDLEALKDSDFDQSLLLYKAIIIQVLDDIAQQITDYNFEGLKEDLDKAIVARLKEEDRAE